ncbi:MAG: Hpt domain-containing protein [Treponema sp.]|nr:Hpt domain-containing protein [Treponema sp.]
MATIYIDMEDGLKRVMNNKKLYTRLLSKFKSGTDLQALTAAVAAGDYEKAEIEAHTIKGIAGNLSLTELFKQSQELDMKFKAKLAKPTEVVITQETIEPLLSCFENTLISIDKVLADYA